MPFFRTVNACAHVSIESATDRVPDDGYYYVLRQGKIEGKFRRLKRAQEMYSKLVAGMNLPPVTAMRLQSPRNTCWMRR